MSRQLLFRRSISNAASHEPAQQVARKLGIDILNKTAPVPLYVEEHPTAGRCLRTQKAFSFGEVLAQERPILTVEDGLPPSFLGYYWMSEDLKQAMDDLFIEVLDKTPQNRLIFDQLTYGDPDYPNLSRVFVNSSLHRLYGHFSIINHSSYPNISIDLHSHEIRATRDIAEGEELTMMAYGPGTVDFCDSKIRATSIDLIQSSLFRCIYERKVLRPREMRAGKFFTSLIYNPGTRPVFDALRPFAETFSNSDTFSIDLDSVLGKNKATDLGKQLRYLISNHSEHDERTANLEVEVKALAKSMLALHIPRTKVMELIGNVFYPTSSPPQKILRLVMSVYEAGKFYLPLHERDKVKEHKVDAWTSDTELQRMH